MNELLEASIHCPYCGERLLILIDPSVDQQHYIEDCQVCCRPIELDVMLDQEGEVSVVASHENE
ncbi:MAG: CPXCG motif-containing cysteine-rich protein [Gammaproteobacteria bacterium]|nr:CPXCG motif-containing cysteine-rich protein [Gammaproteobacteria bacterium]